MYDVIVLFRILITNMAFDHQVDGIAIYVSPANSGDFQSWDSPVALGIPGLNIENSVHGP